MRRSISYSKEWKKQSGDYGIEEVKGEDSKNSQRSSLGESIFSSFDRFARRQRHRCHSRILSRCSSTSFRPFWNRWRNQSPALAAIFHSAGSDAASSSRLRCLPRRMGQRFYQCFRQQTRSNAPMGEHAERRSGRRRTATQRKRRPHLEAAYSKAPGPRASAWRHKGGHQFCGRRPVDHLCLFLRSIAGASCQHLPTIGLQRLRFGTSTFLSERDYPPAK